MFYYRILFKKKKRKKTYEETSGKWVDVPISNGSIISDTSLTVTSRPRYERNEILPGHISLKDIKNDLFGANEIAIMHAP